MRLSLDVSHTQKKQKIVYAWLSFFRRKKTIVEYRPQRPFTSGKSKKRSVPQDFQFNLIALRAADKLEQLGTIGNHSTSVADYPVSIKQANLLSLPPGIKSFNCNPRF